MKWEAMKQWWINTWFTLDLLFWYKKEQRKVKRDAKKLNLNKVGWKTEIKGPKKPL